MDRRTFMKGAALGLGAAAVGAPQAGADRVNLALPSLGFQRKAARTPIQHLVIVMMENRSTDHYLGWYGKENADFDGVQARTYRDLRQGPDGPMVSTEDWGAKGRNNHHGRGFADPDHGWTNGRLIRNGGLNDQWLHPKPGNDEYTLSTYEADDVPVWAQLTRGWQAYDRWHCSVMGPTQPNRYYLYSTQSGGLKSNDLPPELIGEHPEWAVGWDWQTIWGLCQQGGISSRYFFSNLPETAFWGARHVHQTSHVAEFFASCELGTLPQVSFIDPWFTGPLGLANDDHPHSDIRLGQQFLSDIVYAFTRSRHYTEGALVITYDESGGFWDHVDPPRVADDRGTPNDPGGEEDFSQIGWRVPSTIVSPWTKHAGVDHTTYEHASIGRFISENWGLPYLSQRQRSTNSIEQAFRGFQHFDGDVDFTPYNLDLAQRLQLILDPNLEALAAGEVPPVLPISAPSVDAQSDLHRLAETGWFDKLDFNLDHTFDQGFLDSSAIRTLLKGVSLSL
jgi:phospholipase C